MTNRIKLLTAVAAIALPATMAAAQSSSPPTGPVPSGTPAPREQPSTGPVPPTPQPEPSQPAPSGPPPEISTQPSTGPVPPTPPTGPVPPGSIHLASLQQTGSVPATGPVPAATTPPEEDATGTMTEPMQEPVDATAAATEQTQATDAAADAAAEAQAQTQVAQQPMPPAEQTAPAATTTTTTTAQTQAQPSAAMPAAGQTTLATAADVRTGVQVRDTTGGLVGTIESVDASGAVVSTGTARAKIPVASFGRNTQGLVLSMTKAQLEAAVAGQSTPPAS